MSEKDLERAKDQARAQFDSIREMVGAYREAEENGNDEAMDEARQTIDEDPLSIEVRSDWYVPGNDKDSKPSEYMILLCTGGPAVRIVGDLNEYCEPESAKIQYQDWFTAWTDFDLSDDETEDVLTYARNFYYGE